MKFKRILPVLMAGVALFTMLCGGCSQRAYIVDISQTDDGIVVTYSDNTLQSISYADRTTIYDVLDSLNEERLSQGLEKLSFNEFIKEYFSYTSEEVEDMLSLKSTINRSLLSGVSIMSTFRYASSGIGGGILGSIAPSVNLDVIQGSGVIIDLDRDAGDAYVVTNAHVVYDSQATTHISTDVRLYLYGSDTMDVNYNLSYSGIVNDEAYAIKAEVVGCSLTYDLALLKVENNKVLKSSNALEANFSKEADIYLGEDVYAIGNPSGEGMSTASGIITKDSENITVEIVPGREQEYRVMRTDAPINSGNSGGGLFNRNGEIVGIVNAKDETEGIDNMGYAIPSSTARRIVKSMMDNYSEVGTKGVKKAQLGVGYTLINMGSKYNADKGVTEVYEEVQITKVEGGSPFYGKLQSGDIIINMAIGKGTSSSFTANSGMAMKITREHHMLDLLFDARVGDILKLTVRRNGTPTEIYATMSNSYFKILT